MLALLLIAVSLGASNLAASIGIGVSGVDGRARWRIGLVFGLFEAGMPIVGLLLGRGVAGGLGGAAHWVGAGLLVATGLWTVVGALRGGGGDSAAGLPWGRLLVTGLALSVDNLAVGFALGTYRVSLALAAAVIGAVSVAMSLAGLELGDRVGARAGERGELAGGLVLVAVGVAVAANWL